MPTPKFKSFEPGRSLNHKASTRSRGLTSISLSNERPTTTMRHEADIARRWSNLARLRGCSMVGGTRHSRGQARIGGVMRTTRRRLYGGSCSSAFQPSLASAMGSSKPLLVAAPRSRSISMVSGSRRPLLWDPLGHCQSRSSRILGNALPSLTASWTQICKSGMER